MSTPKEYRQRAADCLKLTSEAKEVYARAALTDLTRITAGNPPCRPNLSSTSTTSAPQKLNRGSTAGEKRENVSTIVSRAASAQ